MIQCSALDKQSHPDALFIQKTTPLFSTFGIEQRKCWSMVEIHDVHKRSHIYEDGTDGQV